MNIHVTEISYLELAKEAKSRGDMKGVWRAFKQHRRMMRKQKKGPSIGHGTPINKSDITNLPQFEVMCYAD